MQQSPKLRLWMSVAVLLIAAFAIISRADQLGLWFDEMWAVLHSSTSVQQILAERDVTWPPGYFLTLHAWGSLASWNDFSLHALGAFFGILATAFFIRAGRRLHSPAAGLLAGLAFGTSSYALYFVLEIRGYGLMLLAEGAFLEIYLRWLKHPTRGRTLILAAVQIAMLYTQFILAVVIGLSLLHLLLTAPRRVGRWLIAAALTAIALLPLASQLSKALTLRAAVGSSGPLPNYFTYEFSSFYRAFSAHWDAWLAVILILCATGLINALLRSSRRFGWTARRAKETNSPLSQHALDWRIVLWFGLWGLAIPVFAYITRERSAMFTTRYLSYTLPAIFLLVGIALASLPGKRIGPWVGAAALLILAAAPWQPYDHRPQPTDDGPPLHQLVRELEKRWQPGDTLVVDPNCAECRGLQWWYYQQLYFPQGQIPHAADGSHVGRRVWHLVRQGAEDAALTASVQQGRINTGEFWGPWYLIATLYEAPPSADGLHFGQALRFHGADIQRRPVLHAGDTIGVTLWWSVDTPIPPELSMSLQLLDPSGRVVTQLDGLPTTPGTPAQLDAWKPDTLYLDRRELHVPYQLPAGDYTLHLIVYRYQDGTRLAPERDATPAQTLIIDKAALYSFAAW